MNYLLTMAGILFLSININAQTTEEEYNYITKGYKVQIESGLDMKKGYVMADLPKYSLKFSDKTRMVEFKALYKENGSVPVAILMAYSSGSSLKDYYCIPSSDAPSELWDRLRTQLETNLDKSTAGEIFYTMTFSLMQLYSAQVQVIK